MMTSGLSLVLILALLLPMAMGPAAAQTPAQAPAPAETPPAMQPEPTQIDTGPVPYQQIEVNDVHRAGAVALNFIYVPGKVITCGAGIVAATLAMLVTFGSQYPTAVRAFEEGCGHPWYLKPEYVAGQDPRDER